MTSIESIAPLRRATCAREIASEVKVHDSVFVYREETHSQELCQARQRVAGAVPAGNPARFVSRVPASRNRVRVAQERGPAGGIYVNLPDFQPLGQRPPGIRRLFAA